MARTHIQPHLTVVDVEAGQALILPVTKNQMLAQSLRPPDAQSPKGSAPTLVLQLRSGYALPSSQHQRHVLIQIDADLSP